MASRVRVDNELYVRVPSSEADSRGSCIGLLDQAKELGITKVFVCLDRSMRQNFVNLVKEYESEGFEYFQPETSVSSQHDIFILMVFDLQQ
ncbi:unnamed protein product [Clavelina lepadiformis]|uniref:Ornithine decarboxylase antizyme n=1 Tax=Clavelina lepadiformis TaxID=159417 RepID=A0ABP0FQJ3_CLALP